VALFQKTAGCRASAPAYAGFGAAAAGVAPAPGAEEPGALAPQPGRKKAPNPRRATARIETLVIFIFETLIRCKPILLTGWLLTH
jgi:hypothetical protein